MPMQFRIATLNLEQDHKRWSDRHLLISDEIAALRPDVIVFNEVCVPLQAAKILRDAAIAGGDADHYDQVPHGRPSALTINRVNSRLDLPLRS